MNLGDDGGRTLVQSTGPDIIFTGSDPNFSVVAGDLSLSSPAGTLHNNLGGNNDICGSAVHSDFLGGEVAPVTFRLSNLVDGRDYSIQILLMDFTTFQTDVFINGEIVGAFGDQVDGGVNGLRGIGSFTADDPTQDSTLLGADPLNNPQGRASEYHLRPISKIPEPWTAMIVALALDGAAGCGRR